ncbi:MAG: hypothetical protein KC466_05340 [Myxococcales bacterium]|nr:hypothetical protein [Myxococcales bacterium]
MNPLTDKIAAIFNAPWFRRIWDSQVFWTTWIVLTALAIVVVAAYAWIRRREEPYLRDRAVEAIQGLVYKKAWRRAYDLIREEPFNPEYKRVSALYRIDEILAALRSLYQAHDMTERPVDEIQRLSDQMLALEEEIAEVEAETERKTAFLRKQIEQLESGIRARWSTLPPLPGEETAAAAPSEEPPFESDGADGTRATRDEGA